MSRPWFVTANTRLWKAGNSIDVTVNAIANYRSLQGGTLYKPFARQWTSLRCCTRKPDFGEMERSSHNSGPCSQRTIIEKTSAGFCDKKDVSFNLHNPDFVTAARIALTVNKGWWTHASAKDAGTVDLVNLLKDVVLELLATIEAVEVNPDAPGKG